MEKENRENNCKDEEMSMWLPDGKLRAQSSFLVEKHRKP